MDPQLKGILTSAGGITSTAIATYAAAKGIIPNDVGSQAGLANALLAVGGFAVTGLIAWYHSRQTSQASMIPTINAANNGVSVVPAAEAKAAGITPVDAPLK